MCHVAEAVGRAIRLMRRLASSVSLTERPHSTERCHGALEARTRAPSALFAHSPSTHSPSTHSPSTHTFAVHTCSVHTPSAPTPSACPPSAHPLSVRGAATLAGPGEQPVVLSRCFPSKATAGYASMADRQVLSVNGHSVRNLRHMYALVQTLHAEEDYLRFEVHCVGGNAIVTTATASAEETLEGTLRLYRIPAAASADLVDATLDEFDEVDSQS